MTASMNLLMGPPRPLKGKAEVPGDKSISHRSVLLGALGDGVTRVRGFLDGRDCQATVGVMREMGVRIEFRSPQELDVHGVGLRGLQEPVQVLDCRNSGTTMRLLSGILAGQEFQSLATGTRQLCSRPMGRVLAPLRSMGARAHGRQGDRYAPLAFLPVSELRGMAYELPVASAQVKSCVLLAGLYAQGETEVREPGPTRDHTERMLQAMGMELLREGSAVRLSSQDALQPVSMRVPGDPSSAAFLIVAAALAPHSQLLLPNVGCNPTRTGLVEALQEMGARITLRNRRWEAGEPVADISVEHGPLTARDFGGEIIVRMIDELPLLALACTQAEGCSVIRDAQELRYKESDRIEDTVQQLRLLGANIEGRADGFEILGPTRLQGATVDSRGDHRLAMMLAVAGLLTEEDTRVGDSQVTADSFPNYAGTLRRLGAEAEEVEHSA